MTPKVGFIGLGAIGRPMAKHVVKRFDGMVWNRTGERATAFVAEFGGKVASNPAEIICWAEVVITCLPTSREVREIVERDDNGWRQGQLLIDCTSGDPASGRATAEWLESRGVGFVDAPVSGGTSGAEAGKLTVMAGGEQKWFDRAKRVIEAFGSRVVHVGPPGAGHAVKAVNQVLLAVNIQAAGEGLAALAKLGVPATAALEVINGSSGRSNVTENLIPQRVVTRAYPRTFRLALLDKDVGIALELLQQTAVPSDATATAKRFTERTRKALGEEADHVEAIREIERAAGVEIR
ncbi:MAG: NAD(P)-dependent oxidoreductase [Gemmatimonadetes bacterium]|nr:NAD(P)-dependent oxidoreductase [Gemmatimonadota bacterium]